MIDDSGDVAETVQNTAVTIHDNSSDHVAEIKCPAVIINNIRVLKCERVDASTLGMRRGK